MSALAQFGAAEGTRGVQPSKNRSGDGRAAGDSDWKQRAQRPSRDPGTWAEDQVVVDKLAGGTCGRVDQRQLFVNGEVVVIDENLGTKITQPGENRKPMKIRKENQKIPTVLIVDDAAFMRMMLKGYPPAGRISGGWRSRKRPAGNRTI